MRERSEWTNGAEEMSFIEGDDKKFRPGLTKKFDAYYGKDLIAAFGQKKLSQITAGDVERFLMKLSRTKTAKGTLFAPSPVGCTTSG